MIGLVELTSAAIAWVGHSRNDLAFSAFDRSSPNSEMSAPEMNASRVHAPHDDDPDVGVGFQGADPFRDPAPGFEVEGIANPGTVQYQPSERRLPGESKQSLGPSRYFRVAQTSRPFLSRSPWDMILVG